jgi:hypothetical protein
LREGQGEGNDSQRGREREGEGDEVQGRPRQLRKEMESQRGGEEQGRATGRISSLLP